MQILSSMKQRLMAGAGVVAAMAGMGVAAQAQVVPLTEIVQSKVLTTVNGNAGHIAANSLGDVFYVSQTDNVAYWLPRGRTTPIALVTGLSGGRSVYVSANNNVYVSSNYSGRVIEVPYANGTYTTNTANSSGLPTCTASPTAPCLAFGNGAGATGYYLQASDLGFDQTVNGQFGPNAYVIDERDNVCNQSNTATSCNTILKFVPAANGVYNATVVVTGLPQTNNGQIAVGPKGDVYYADGTSLYYIAAGATTATMIGTGLVSPTGVTTDVYGNLYITDSGSGANKIYEMPAVNGVARPSSQFIFLNTYSANGIAFDGLGHVFYTAYSGGTNINQASLNAFGLGSTALGTPVSATATTLTVQFTGAVTLGTITLNGASAGFSYVVGTCATGTSYIATSSCTINVNYTPTAVGLQKGAVVLASSANVTIGVANLSGAGLGAVQTTDPGTLSTIGTGLTNPLGVAVDGAKDLFIADAGQNAVFEYAPGSSTGTKVGSGLVGPTSVATDNAGNLYIADSGNGRVVMVPNVGGTLTTTAQTVVVSGLGTSLGIATDLINELYIADATKNQVLQLGTIAGLPNAANTVKMGLDTSGASTFTAPIAVATDPTGNLFIADTTANKVTEITFYGKQTINIGTGYSHPTGLAADASGSLYIADSGNGRLLKVPYENPIFNTNDQYTLGGAIGTPYGVAIDSSSNLYVVDNSAATAYFLNRAQGTLALGRANINTSTSQSNAYIGNAGNQTLSLGNPAYVATGNTTVFNVTSPSTGGCTSSAAISSGFACTLAATFSPTVIGNYSETLAFTSNATNTASPSLLITGIGLNQAITTTTLAQTSPAGAAAFGQPVVITATIASQVAGTATGTATFFVDGAQQPKPATVTNGTASISLTGLTGGNHTIGASYSGDNSFAPSSANTITITVLRTSSSVALTTNGGFQNPPSAAPGAALTLIATVTTSASTVPTGTASFSLGTTVLGSASVGPVVTKLNGVTTTKYQASLPISTLPTGTDVVTATYNGDVNYASSSTSLTITITPATFALTPSSASVTVTAGGTATVPLQVSSQTGFAGIVGLSCSGLPANATCGFSPNGFIVQSNNLITAEKDDSAGNVIVPATFGPMNVTLSIITGTVPGVPQPPVGEVVLPGFGTRVPISLAFLVGAPLLWIVRRRLKSWRRLQMLMALVLLGTAATFFSGCGSVTSGPVAVSPKGTYTVMVTATSTSTGTSTILAPGCAFTPSGATAPTCVQTTQVNLVVQ
jgi:sugar lactone lactonase YvrE